MEKRKEGIAVRNIRQDAKQGIVEKRKEGIAVRRENIKSGIKKKVGAIKEQMGERRAVIPGKGGILPTEQRSDVLKEESVREEEIKLDTLVEKYRELEKKALAEIKRVEQEIDQLRRSSGIRKIDEVVSVSEEDIEAVGVRY